MFLLKTLKFCALCEETERPTTQYQSRAAVTKTLNPPGLWFIPRPRNWHFWCSQRNIHIQIPKISLSSQLCFWYWEVWSVRIRISYKKKKKKLWLHLLHAFAITKQYYIYIAYIYNIIYITINIPYTQDHMILLKRSVTFRFKFIRCKPLSCFIVCFFFFSLWNTKVEF